MDATLRARLHPLGAGRYSVVFDGKLLIERSRDPECDAARALLKHGYTGKLHMLDGKTGKPRTIINIEKAAKLTTEEGPNGPLFRRFQRHGAGAYIPERESRGQLLRLRELSQRQLPAFCPYVSRPCTHKSSLVSSGWSMSALPPKADILFGGERVRYVPEADIVGRRSRGLAHLHSWHRRRRGGACLPRRDVCRALVCDHAGHADPPDGGGTYANAAQKRRAAEVVLTEVRATPPVTIG